MKDRKRMCIILALSLGLLLLVAAVLVIQTINGTPKVGVCLRQFNDNGTQAFWNSFHDGLRAQGYRTMVADAKNDQSQQDAQIAEMLKKGCDFLVVEPVMVAAADTVVQQARQAQVPLIFLNREPDAQILNSWESVYYVGGKLGNAGTIQGKIPQQLPGEGDLNGDGVVSYVMLQADPQRTDVQANSQGFAAEAKNAVCLETVSTDGTKASGTFRSGVLLAKYGKDIELIVCSTDEIALGAVEAVQGGGWVPGVDICVVGIGSNSEALEMVTQNVLSGTVVQDVDGVCEATITVIGQLLSGGQVEKTIYVDHLSVISPGPLVE